MRVTVKLFAVLRDRAGAAGFDLDLPPGATAGDALDVAAERFPALAGLVGRIACAVNQCYVRPGEVLREGDELALIPPVSGGSDGPDGRMTP